MQEVGALGAILIESLRQSKSVGSNLSQAGKIYYCAYSRWRLTKGPNGIRITISWLFKPP